jgi:hypothetical protein
MISPETLCITLDLWICSRKFWKREWKQRERSRLPVLTLRSWSSLWYNWLGLVESASCCARTSSSSCSLIDFPSTPLLLLSAFSFCDRTGILCWNCRKLQSDDEDSLESEDFRRLCCNFRDWMHLFMVEFDVNVTIWWWIGISLMQFDVVGAVRVWRLKMNLQPCSWSFLSFFLVFDLREREREK